MPSARLDTASDYVYHRPACYTPVDEHRYTPVDEHRYTTTQPTRMQSDFSTGP
jgi:hypothetical protein